MIGEVSGCHKIGKSKDPEQRLKQIACGDDSIRIRGTIAAPDMGELERFLHEAFAHRRVKGEWFRLTESEIELILALVSDDNLRPLLDELRRRNASRGFAWGEFDASIGLPACDLFVPSPRVAELESLIATEVAVRLRAVRARLNMTLREAGAKSRIHYVTISRYEQGKLPTIGPLYQLAEAYGVEVKDLLPDVPKSPVRKSKK